MTCDDSLLTDIQEFGAHLTDFSPENGSGTLIFLAIVIHYAGYVTLGATLFDMLCPCKHPILDESKPELYRNWERRARKTRIRHDRPQLPSTDTFLHVTAYALHTDRTGAELRRIADFLEKTTYHRLAAPIRQQLPTPRRRKTTSPT